MVNNPLSTPGPLSPTSAALTGPSFKKFGALFSRASSVELAQKQQSHSLPSLNEEELEDEFW